MVLTKNCVAMELMTDHTDRENIIQNRTVVKRWRVEVASGLRVMTNVGTFGLQALVAASLMPCSAWRNPMAYRLEQTAIVCRLDCE